jgi:glycosyltransferase involved in cell wall biosynthesis
MSAAVPRAHGYPVDAGNEKLRGHAGAGDRLRIAYVYDALYPLHRGGAERRYRELATRMSARHEVHYVTWHSWQGSPPDELDGVVLHSVGAAPGFYGADGRRTVREATAFAARLIPTLLHQRFDVIDCSATPYVPLYAVWLASLLTRTPLVVTWHEFWGPYWSGYLPDRPLLAGIARRIEAGCRTFGTRRIAVSPFTAGRMMEAGGGGTPVEVIGNGISLSDIDAAAPGAESDIVFVGRLIADKKVDHLLEAVALLVGDRPRLRCTIVGDGPERTALESLAGSLGITGNVHFTGPIAGDAVFSTLKAGALLALPSIREGFGITVVEAQACGAVPIVARSPLSAAPDLVRDGVDGVVHDPTPSALAAAIGGLLANPERRAAMRERGREAAAGRDWGVVADQMEAIYRSVTADRHRTAGVERVRAHV